MAVNGELKRPSSAVLSLTDSEENGAIGLDLLSNGDTDSTRPASASGSHGQQAPSTTQSMTSVSLEERLKRMRAAEELKQQQRYAAFIESQRQADLVRMRAQEERKRKIEELRQREEARRSLVLERRRELEQSNKARMEVLRERSRAREESIQNPRRRVTDTTAGFGRTASASPSLGSARNPNQLMTTSCVVAFGSSAPRSICTQPSPAALRLQKAFEARLASYLTGRHSGCFLTSSAAPHYTRLIDRIDPQVRTASALTFLLNRQARTKLTGETKNKRRAISAHAPLISHTKASVARSTRLASTRKRSENAGISDDNASSFDTPNRSHETTGNEGQLRWLEPPDPDEVSGRSNSSQDCNKLGRPPRVPNGSEMKKSSKPSSVSSCNSSTVGSVRSVSVDTLPRPTNAAHVASVFERLTANVKGRAKTTQSTDDMAKPAAKARPAAPQTKKPTAAAASRPGTASSKPVPKGMSQSVYMDRKRPPDTKPSNTLRKRSASPPHTVSVPNKTELPESTSKSTPPEPEPVPAAPEVEPVLENSEQLQKTESQDRVAPEAVESPPKSESTAAGNLATLAYTGPIKAETQGSGEGAVLNENEAAIYRAKLVEQRRLAKERKEEEQRRLEEENRQRRMQQEAARLAAEQAAREQAELAAREAAELQRQREEEEKARLEAAEAERLAKLQRAEEERIMRKKKLDSIMSRVKQTQGGASATASSPALQAQDEPSSIPARGDVSDSQLFEHSNTATTITNGDMTVSHSTETVSLGTNHLEDGKEQVTTTDSVSPSDAIVDAPRNKLNPVSFSLCTELDDEPVSSAPPEVDASGDHTWSSMSYSETDKAQDASHSPSSPTQETPGANKPLTDSNRSSGRVSPVHNRAMSPAISQSPSEGSLLTRASVFEPTQTHNGSGSVISTGAGASTATSTAIEAPRFKSALLQSMLGGGRLATRAKDAVAGLRRGSANQLGDTQSLNSREGSGGHSPVYWTQGANLMDPNPDGDFMSSHLQTGSRESLKYNSGYGSHSAVSMVRSMFDGSPDRYHINGSSDVAKPNGSAMYGWQPSPDCDLAAPESMSPRPVHTSTN